MTNTFAVLCAILVKDYQIDPASLTLDAPLETLGIDSLGVAELLFTVEDEFSVRLSPDSVALTTIGEVVCYVDEVIAAQHGAGVPAVGAPAS